MEKSRKNRIARLFLIIVGVPLLLIWTLIALLYVPAIQQYAVDTICRKIAQSSGYDIRIGYLHLSFPLQLEIEEFAVSKGEDIYAEGEKAGLNVSLWPLLAGEIELNYIEIDNIRLDTRELIPDVAIEGEVEYLRAVARNIDLTRERADLRQLHINGTSLEVTLTDTIPDDEDESTPTGWILSLRRGTLTDCSISLNIPADTLRARLEIGKANIAKAVAEIGEKSYRVEQMTFSGSNATYDKGHRNKEEYPLEHIRLNDIAFDCSDIMISPALSHIDMNSLTLEQPGGITIAESSGSISSDTASLEISAFSLSSKSGSSLAITGTIPWGAFSNGNQAVMEAEAKAILDKRDLGALLTQEQHDMLSPFGEKLFATHMRLKGNSARMDIDTISVSLPSFGIMSAKGYLKSINDRERLSATMDINGHAHDIRRIIAYASGDTLNTVNGDSIGAELRGNLGYSSGIAQADIIIATAEGEIKAKGVYEIAQERYDAKLTADSINIASIMPSVPIGCISLAMEADGRGTDIFSDSTSYRIALKVDTIRYGDIAAGNISINASQANLISKIIAEGNDPNLTFLIDADTKLHDNSIDNSTDVKVTKADFGKMNIVNDNFAAELHMNMEISTDLGERHAMKFFGENIRILTDIRTFTPKDINVAFYTAPDSTSLKGNNGDLNVSGAMDCGYKGLFESLKKTGALFLDALEHENTVHYMQDYQRLLPELRFAFSCGRDNMLANFLAMKGMTANFMRMNIDTDTVTGLNIRGGIYGFKKGDLNLDTIRILTRQENDRIRYYARVRSTALNPQNEKQSYNAMLYGNLINDSLTTNFVFRDKNEEAAVKIGATTILKPHGLDMRFNPDAILLAEPFRFNEGNHINIGKGLSVDAELTLSDNHGSGLHLHAAPEEGDRQNASATFFNIDLKKLTGIIPYAPELAGTLDLDLNMTNSDKGIMLSADMHADGLSYEGVYIGNETIEAVYFPKKDNTHYLDLLLLHDEEEVAHLSGNYGNGEEAGLDGSITLTRFPLAVSKAFLKESGVALQGFVSGNMRAEGMLNHLNTNGHIQFESVDIDAFTLGTSLHVPDATTPIINNRLQFKDFSIYAMGDNPFKINGDVDFSRLLDPAFNLRMSATNYELINAPRRRGAMFYGRLFVDVRAMIGGSLSNMKFYGDVTMKSKSNITYVMTDAPIESDKELDGLVEFVNFKDTTAVAVAEKEIDLGNIGLNLNLTIDDGARINADLDEGRNNYVTTEGSGNLHLTYSGDAGINVTGRYAMRDGEFKLNLPVIPLKTLAISDGSEVSWSGELLNPSLDVTALERVTTSVTFDDNSTLPVPFDVGVKVSNTLEQMGLSFIMSSPENPTIQEQLNALDTEEMNRYAVTMLLTGAYAGSKSMTAANALSSFIDAKINDIAGTAMKSINVNVGINDATNAETGDTYKNYSFSFSKRFWNDRVTLVVGGEVNSGKAPDSSNSFINNASLEWKLSENSNRYLKLFYDKNYQSILEGEIIETGIGYVYKRKLNRLKELFIFRNAKKAEKQERDKPAHENSNSENGEETE